ncbi:MAG: hypothetical protein MJ162_07785 [Treponema sp.]|nr:hypothetical protein [Treponema sp.]
MELQEALDLILPSFQRYYTIKTEGVEAPFAAEADFEVHTEQYVLVKIAKIAEIDAKEYLYFALVDNPSADTIKELAAKAWEQGLAKVEPYYGHKSSDVALFIISKSMDENALTAVKKTKYSKNYKFGFYGWSNFKLVSVELDKKQCSSNRLGADFKKLIGNILFPKGGKEKK